MKKIVWLVSIFSIILFGCETKTSQSDLPISPITKLTFTPIQTPTANLLSTRVAPLQTPTPIPPLATINSFATFEAMLTGESGSQNNESLPSRIVTEIPTAISTSLPINYRKGTPLPPLSKNDWIPEPVLISFKSTCGDGCDLPPAPYLMLYADGTLIRSNDQYASRPEYTNLNKFQICKVLNTLDQLGLFEYDPTVYKNPEVHAPSFIIKVNAWESNYVDHVALDSSIAGGLQALYPWCEDCAPSPVVLPAIHNTYLFLSEFDPGGWKYYEANSFLAMIFISESPIAGNYEPWPFSNPTLTSIFDAVGERNIAFVQFEVDNGSKWRGDNSYEYYTDGELYASVIYRPLFPHENNSSAQNIGSKIEQTNKDIPTEPLVCEKADGVYDLPPLK